MRKLIWESNPDLGFWIDNDPVRLYAGTEFNVELIAEIGLLSPDWVSLNLDPYTALRGGDVLVLEIPARWLMDHMDQRFGANKRTQQDRLLDKDLFLKWRRPVHEYYTDAVVRVVKQVPARYIIGYMQHKG